MNWFYRFTVEWYCEDERQTITDSGLVVGENYADAVKKIADYFGDDCICELKLFQVGDSENILLSEDVADAIKE